MKPVRDESGSALILALVMVSVVGAMLAAALSFADTSLIATPALVEHRTTYNSADGAVEGAINAVRGSATLGTDGAPVSCDFPDYDPSDGVNVVVQCIPQAGSGSAADDQPPFAIQLLGTGGADGFIQTGNTQLTVDGGMYSNGKLDLTGGGSQAAFLSYGDVFVEGNCTPTPGGLLDSVGGLVKCDYAGDARGDDPDYPPGASGITGMSVDPAASCTSPSSVVAFNPGVYTEIPEAPAGCNGSVWWFKPGVYYFDFPDITGRFTWTPDALPGKTVVGGTLKSGWSASTNASTVTLPGACDPSADGVQFIFGGPSLLSVTSQGKVELCGGVNATNYKNHRITLTSLKNEPARTAVGPAATPQTGTPMSPGPTGEVVYALADPAASTIDNVFAEAVLSTTGKALDEADVTLPEFADIPVGSRIDKVELNVRHFATDNAVAAKAFISLPSGVSADKSLTAFSATECTTALTSCTDTWDITSYFTGRGGYKELNGLAARYYAKVNGNKPAVVDSLDGMSLSVTYTPPGFEQHRCPTGQSGCSVVTSTVSQNLFFHGTVYVPTAGLNLRVHNKDTTIFDRGVIARTMNVDVSASSKQTDSPFQIPRATTGRSVLFVAKVDGVDTLRALVRYQDYVTTAGTNSAYPGYRVFVEKWSVIR